MSAETIFLAFTAGGAVMLTSLIGKLTTYRFLGSWVSRNLPYLVSLAGGVFIVTIWHLSEEALHEGTSLAFIITALGGAAVLWVSTQLISSTTHHHHELEVGHTHSEVDGRRVLMSDSIHNIGDGIIIALAFAVDIAAGVGVLLGIVLHEMVQEVSEFFVLKEAGYSDRKALTYNFMVSSTILIGIALGSFISGAEALATSLSGIATGALVFVILFDLLPNALSCIREHRGTHKHIIALFVGAVLMLGVQTLAPEEHEVTAARTNDLTSITVR